MKEILLSLLLLFTLSFGAMTQNEMAEKNFGGILVDVCEDGCKGIWFDWNELNRLDEKNEGLGKALKKSLTYPRVNDDNRVQIKCPRCREIRIDQ